MNDEAIHQHGPGDFIGGRYLLGDRIGVGGMGVVYEAQQPSLQRTVAVKLLRAELQTNTLALRRFRDEALAAGRVHHNHVARVIDFGETTSGALYLVMERLHGEPFGQLIARQGPLSLRRAAHIVDQLLSGLDECHRAGIVHGDIKSDNMLVDVDRAGNEVATLIDFGLAQRSDQPRALPLAETIVSGTPDYIAPELVRGGAPTELSDIYAVGVILYEAITASTPFGGGSATNIMDRHVEEAVIPPSLRCPHRMIPSAFERVILRALAKQPTARFATVRQFAQALVTATPAVEPIPYQVVDAPSRGMRSATGPTRDCSARPETPQVVHARTTVGLAIGHGDVDDIAIAYLRLAHALVSEHRLVSARVELDEAVDLLTQGDGPGMVDAPAPLWRILLAVAALTDGLGDAGQAQRGALDALDHATRADSKVGRDRARALLEGLQQRRRRAA